MGAALSSHRAVRGTVGNCSHGGTKREVLSPAHVPNLSSHIVPGTTPDGDRGVMGWLGTWPGATPCQSAGTSCWDGFGGIVLGGWGGWAGCFLSVWVPWGVLAPEGSHVLSPPQGEESMEVSQAGWDISACLPCPGAGRGCPPRTEVEVASLVLGLEEASACLGVHVGPFLHQQLHVVLAAALNGDVQRSLAWNRCSPSAP